MVGFGQELGTLSKSSIGVIGASFQGLNQWEAGIRNRNRDQILALVWDVGISQLCQRLALTLFQGNFSAIEQTYNQADYI